MQPMFESHPQVAGCSPGLHQVLRHPDVFPEPVLQGEQDADAAGASIYGSVVRDGGLYRMWYQAWPRDWPGGDSVTVGCVESDDGLTWRRPAYGLVDCCGSRDNHLTDLPFHSPSVVIDPHAGPGARFRAFGFSGPRRLAGRFAYELPCDGYYTAHSADGIHWEVECARPLWPFADVITAAWDPWSDCAQIALKRNGRVAGLFRRCFHTATWSGSGGPSAAAAAFIPDEFDDLNARARGFVSADYYGVAVMPAAGPTIGILWNFRHLPPLQHNSQRMLDYASTGSVDLSLVYRREPHGRWLHLPGRPDWLAARDAPVWARGALYTAATPLEVGDETWLYFTGTPGQHGWCGAGVDRETFRQHFLDKGGFARIGLLKWPRDRLMGFHAELTERLQLKPRAAGTGAARGLWVNLAAGAGGFLRARLLDASYEPVAGFGFDDCVPVTGDTLCHQVRWRGQAETWPAGDGESPVAELEFQNATLYAFDYVAD